MEMAIDIKKIIEQASTQSLKLKVGYSVDIFGAFDFADACKRNGFDQSDVIESLQRVFVDEMVSQGNYNRVRPLPKDFLEKIKKLREAKKKKS